MQEGGIIMSKRYLIVLVSPNYLSGKGKYVAGSKAPNDVTEILKNEGFEILPIVRKSLNKIWGIAESIIKLWWTLRRLPKGATVYVQYPMFNIKPFSRLAPMFRRFNSVILIHDIRTYCQPFMVKYRDKELSIINCFNTVIVHSESMKIRLAADGVKGHIVVLGAFDYLLDEAIEPKIVPNTIMFAGALGKSDFLNRLHDLNLKAMTIHLYGASKPDITYDEHIIYKGRFSPNDVSMVEAEWGLLWEGDSIETCGGCHGEYLRLIAPHKLSLYLACGLKIICWEHSAMANLIREKGLGITIANLSEIEEKINGLSRAEKAIIEKNVDKIKYEIRHGEMLRKVVRQIQ